VNTHDIPPDLVYNSDHTPVHFIQLKGKAWQVDDSKQGTMGKGDKRQFTCVLTVTAAGRMVGAQIVMEGKTSDAGPYTAIPPFIG